MKQIVILHAVYCLLWATAGSAQPDAGASCHHYAPALTTIRQDQYERVLELLSECYTLSGFCGNTHPAQIREQQHFSK